ncbi:inverse autotransporter beta domain-containing protein, partial [Providencia manganoxydans]
MKNSADVLRSGVNTAYYWAFIEEQIMEKHRPVSRTRTFRVAAWTNIITQLLFPVAASLTPVWVSAAAKSQNEIQYTQAYKLKTGETVASVAKQHHLTVNQLKKVNQFRTFSKPFNTLSAGDEIDIPWDNAPDVSDNHSTDAAASSDVFWADSSTQVANALKSGDPSKVALDKARGLATDAATQEIQNWLKGYGTARVKLGVDDKARLEGSELDLLLPLYDTQSQLTYTQMGLRHVDKRTTANVGLGQRLFLDSHNMLGYNAFLDHDITGKHTRMGLGAEYWRDYLKLGANGYFRLSGWRDAHNLEGYDARPANGFDIRGEAYLPAYPQLGGKLTYEQYFGDEVGLFGKNKRKKDPSAVTVGVNYTPFPLLTLGVERRQGTDSGGETQFNLGLKYEIGTPWEKQVDTNAVDKLRSLAGSRYDLVERNNQIVLEYRKQETIRLALASHITGRAGETKSLGVNISAPHGLKSIQWDAASLLAHGGQIIETAPGQYSVKLPDWQATGQNSYTITGRATDNKGNTSEPATTQVTVSSVNISAENSTFVAEPNQLPADGTGTSVLTLTVKDANGNPISGISDQLKLNVSGDGEAVLSPVKEVSPGVYQTTLTAGTTAGDVKITPVVDGVTLPAVDIAIIGNTVVPEVGKLTLHGSLAVGNALSATYVFTDGLSEKSTPSAQATSQDKSTYAWGDKGTTANTVNTGKGQTVETSGTVPSYTLVNADVGKVKEVSVQAENGLGVTGNTLTLATDASEADGND